MKRKSLVTTVIVAGFTLGPINAAEEEPNMPVGGKNILKAFDTNKDKKLGADEIERTGPKNQKTLISRYDKNLDGTITMKELGVTAEDLVEKKEKSGGKKKKGKKKRKKGKR